MCWTKIKFSRRWLKLKLEYNLLQQIKKQKQILLLKWLQVYWIVWFCIWQQIKVRLRSLVLLCLIQLLLLFWRNETYFSSNSISATKASPLAAAAKKASAKKTTFSFRGKKHQSRVLPLSEGSELLVFQLIHLESWFLHN